MDPKDIKWLFPQIKLCEKVKIIDEPVKVALEPDRSVFVEAHEPLTRSDGSKKDMMVPQQLSWWLDEFDISDVKARAVILSQNGVPTEVVAPSYVN